MIKRLVLLWLLSAFMTGAAAQEEEGTVETGAITGLEPSVFHTVRASLSNAHHIFEQEKKGRVAFQGGSITYNGGWRDSVCHYLEKRFPDTDFDFVAAGISSMGSTPGAFRLERDVLSRGRIDLFFEEAAVNDATNGRTDTEQLRAMEGIFRHMRSSNPACEMVMMHCVDPEKMELYRRGEEPAVIKNHNKVAEHYQISTINWAKEVTARIDSGEFSWEEDFLNLHPSAFGQGIYARSLIHYLDSEFSKPLDPSAEIRPHLMPEKLEPHCYDDGQLIGIEQATALQGWKIDSNWTPQDSTGTRANYTEVPMLVAVEPGSSLSFSFSGSTVGLAVAAGQDAGIVEYRIDKEPWKTQNLFTKWSKQLHLPWYYTLVSELTSGSHTLELRIANEKDERSTGNACRIRYFFVDE